MKRFWLLACAVLIAGAVSQGEIKFLRGKLSEAVTRAQTEKKPVMIDFITDWCRWCDTLDARTYSDAAVAEYINSHLVPIKIDAEKGEGIEIAKKYSVRGYPTILLITADGEEIDRLLGYSPPEPFLKSVKDYVEGKNTIGQLKSSLEKNPSDPALRYTAASKYAARSDMASAAEHFRKLLELDPENTLGHNEEAEYTLAVNAMRAEKNLVPLSNFVEKYPASPMARSALATLVMTSANNRDSTTARKYFEVYTTLYPEDAVLMNNYAWACAEKKLDLDNAAKIAEKAAALAKTDGERAMYLDTQATIEFNRGNAATAIALEEKALGLLKDAPAKERKEYEATLAKFKGGQK